MITSKHTCTHSKQLLLRIHEFMLKITVSKKNWVSPGQHLDKEVHQDQWRGAG